MPVSDLESRIGRILFECCQAPKSRLTMKKLIALGGSDAFNAATENRWIVASGCDPWDAKTAWLISLGGRDALRRINNASVSATLTLADIPPLPHK